MGLEILKKVLDLNVVFCSLQSCIRLFFSICIQHVLPSITKPMVPFQGHRGARVYPAAVGRSAVHPGWPATCRLFFPLSQMKDTAVLLKVWKLEKSSSRIMSNHYYPYLSVYSFIWKKKSASDSMIELLCWKFLSFSSETLFRALTKLGKSRDYSNSCSFTSPAVPNLHCCFHSLQNYNSMKDNNVVI